MFVPLAPAAKNTQRGPPALLPGKAFGGMLGAMARIAPAGGTARSIEA